MDMPRFARPIVAASKCLGFAACRYNGEIVADGFVARLREFAEIIPVCPELEIGLGVPREKIRLVAGEGDEREPRLVQPATGRDLTEDMLRFSRRYIAGLEARGGIDGFILKSSSPSCGIGDTKIFTDWETEDYVDRQTGLFARAVLATYPDLAVEDERRLADARVRRRFLTRIFERARDREAGGTGARKRPVGGGVDTARPTPPTGAGPAEGSHLRPDPPYPKELL